MDQYELNLSIVREYCDFFSHQQTRPSDSTAYQILTDLVCAQRGIILHHCEDSQRSGVAVAAFSSGIRVYKTRHGVYQLTSELSWDVIEQARRMLNSPRASAT